MAPAPAGPTEALTSWLRGLFVGDAGGHGPRSLAPKQPGHAAEAPAVHLPRTARASIETEGGWVRGIYRTADGRRCAMGALHAAARPGWRGVRAGGSARPSAAAAKERGFGGVEPMDDSSTHAQVLAAFDAAIGHAESRPPPAG